MMFAIAFAVAETMFQFVETKKHLSLYRSPTSVASPSVCFYRVATRMMNLQRKYLPATTSTLQIQLNNCVDAFFLHFIRLEPSQVNEWAHCSFGVYFIFGIAKRNRLDFRWVLDLLPNQMY